MEDESLGLDYETTADQGKNGVKTSWELWLVLATCPSFRGVVRSGAGLGGFVLMIGGLLEAACD